MQHPQVLDSQDPLREVELFLSVVNGGTVPLGGNGLVFVHLNVPTDQVAAYREELEQVLLDPTRRQLGSFDRASFEQGFTAALQGLAIHTEHHVGRLNDAIIEQGATTLRVEVGRAVLVRSALSNDLCRCKTCGNFFLAKHSETGRPRREFCSAEHCEEFYNKQASARVRKSRQDPDFPARRARRFNSLSAP